MYRKTVSGVMLVLLVTSMLVLAAKIQPVRAMGTITINPDGSITPSAQIYTANNITYTLTGNITSSADGIVIERDNIVLDGSGYTVQGGGSGGGIKLNSITNVTIKNTAISNFTDGIWLYYSSHNTLSNNNATGNGLYGIVLADSSYNVLSANNLTGNGYGVGLSGSSYNTVWDNNASANVNFGIHLDTDILNTPSNGNTLSGNDASGNMYGVYLLYSYNNTLSDNNVTGNSYQGIHLYSCSDNTLSGNNIANDSYGIDAAICDNNVLSGNNVTANNEIGIYLYSSSGNTLSGNGAANNWVGIALSSSSGNALSGNNVTASDDIGVMLSSSSGNALSGNNVTKNKLGILLYSSDNNAFYHNNFISNTQQVNSANFALSGPNSWDNGYPSGGNYWSDYAGVDVKGGPNQNQSGSDGIGDTPYVIGINNTDNYPLMQPWVAVESLVVRGMDDRIYYQVWNGADWEGWNVFPGSTIDSPAAAVLGNQLHVVVRGSDGNSLWYGHLTNITDPRSFAGWTLLSGATSSAPTLTSNGTALCLVVRGLDNSIYYRAYDAQAQAWQGWNALPSGTTCDKPAAAMLGSTLYIVVRGYSTTSASANNTLWYSTVNLTDNAFSGWTMLSGATPSSPTLTASQTSNSLYLTVRGNDNRIYVNTWNGGNWQGWNALPTGATINGPAATIVGTKLYFVVIGMDGTSIWQSSLDPTTNSFTGWTLLSGATSSAPTLTS